MKVMMKKMKLMIGAISLSKEKYAAVRDEARKVFDEVVINTYGRQMTKEEVLEKWKGVDAIVCGTEPYTRDMIFQAPDTLKVISKHGVGVDNIDLEACKERGIVVCNTPGANAVAVAEAAIGLILSVLRRIPYSDALIRSGNWKRPEGSLIQGATVGVLGMGNVGKNLIKRAEAFGARFMAYDPYFDETFAREHHVTCASMEEILRQADIISLHVPSTPETHNLINERSLASMKKNAVLINTARGDLIDETALYNALKNGVISGAGLDVFSEEPLKASPLFELNNVVLTPHMAGNTAQTTLQMGLRAMDNAVKIVTGAKGATIVHH